MPDEPSMFLTCPSHDEYITPMIFTFAFSGAEYWCPHCGYKCGMFGSMGRAPIATKLIARHDAFESKYMPYLKAMSVLYCVSLKHNGVEMKPEDLPEEALEQFAKDRETWKKGVKIEEGETCQK